MAYPARYRMETAAVLPGRTDQNYFARRFEAHYGLSAATCLLRGVTLPTAAGDDAS